MMVFTDMYSSSPNPVQKEKKKREKKKRKKEKVKNWSSSLLEALLTWYRWHGWLGVKYQVTYSWYLFPSTSPISVTNNMWCRNVDVSSVPRAVYPPFECTAHVGLEGCICYDPPRLQLQRVWHRYVTVGLMCYKFNYRVSDLLRVGTEGQI